MKFMIKYHKINICTTFLYYAFHRIHPMDPFLNCQPSVSSMESNSTNQKYDWIEIATHNEDYFYQFIKYHQYKMTCTHGEVIRTCNAHSIFKPNDNQHNMIISISNRTCKYCVRSQFKYKVKHCLSEKINTIRRLSFDHSNKYINTTDQIYDHQHGYAKVIKEKLSEPINYNPVSLLNIVTALAHVKNNPEFR